MRKPVFLDDIKFLGEWYWCEIEGFEKVVRKQSGGMAFLEHSIMGWDVDTLGDVWKKQKEVNFAPRIRFWESESADDKPTAEERAAGGWEDLCRMWYPPYFILMDDSRMEEFKRTGRTVWDEKEGEE